MIILFSLFCLLSINLCNQGHLPVITPHMEHTILHQQTTLQMSTLSLMGSNTQQAYLELLSLPHGIGKIQITETDMVTGSALRWMFNDEVVLSMNPKQISTNAETAEFQNLRIQKKFFFQGQPQWRLVIQEQFWQAPLGWSDNSITTCGGLQMLGGYGKFAGGEVRKTFTEIPEHSKIRIVANFHFIDAWSGESGFMRASVGRDKRLEYVWTEKYDHSKIKNGINVCGAPYPEGKLTSHIDVVVAHIEEEVTVGFGSTLDDDPQENSFGVSNLQLYVI